MVTGGHGLTCVTAQVLENRHSYVGFILTVSYLKI